jgi:hypothetical protein
LAPKASSGLRSASIVKIESESVSLIFSLSAQHPLGKYPTSSPFARHSRGFASFQLRQLRATLMTRQAVSSGDPLQMTNGFCSPSWPLRFRTLCPEPSSASRPSCIASRAVTSGECRDAPNRGRAFWTRGAMLLEIIMRPEVHLAQRNLFDCAKGRPFS